MLLSLLALAFMAPRTITIVPKETVWVYANASSPTDGTFLRAWGTDGKSCPGEGEDLDAYSYSFLKWDLSDVPADAKLVSASLELSNISDPGFNLDSSKKAPLEARALNVDFDAKAWTYDMASKIRPINTKAGLLGSGYAQEIHSGSPVQIVINLQANSNVFAKTFTAASSSPSRQLCMAITSALDPSVEGRSCVYKVYGQSESKESLRPRLVLVFER